MEKRMTYISYVIQTAGGPVFDHEKIHIDHEVSFATFHNVATNAVIKWADNRTKELPEGQRLTVLNFFTFENDK